MKLFKKTLYAKQALYVASLSILLATSGCSVFGVYKIDLPQGTPITQSQASKITLGMTQNEVVYLLGSPALRDTMAPKRWDYVYDYTPGTYGKREGKNIIRNASQHLIITFDDSGVVNNIQGIETLPTQRP